MIRLNCGFNNLTHCGRNEWRCLARQLSCDVPSNEWLSIVLDTEHFSRLSLQTAVVGDLGCEVVLPFVGEKCKASFYFGSLRLIHLACAYQGEDIVGFLDTVSVGVVAVKIKHDVARDAE